MTTETKRNRTRIITLSDRRPIQIIDEDWVEMSRAEWKEVGPLPITPELIGSILKRNAERTSSDPEDAPEYEANIRVRKNIKTREFVVYATYDTFGFEKDVRLREGKLLDSTASNDGSWEVVVSTIKSVIERLCNRITTINLVWIDSIRALAPMCIAGLPPEDRTSSSNPNPWALTEEQIKKETDLCWGTSLIAEEVLTPEEMVAAYHYSRNQIAVGNHHEAEIGEKVCRKWDYIEEERNSDDFVTPLQKNQIVVREGQFTVSFYPQMKEK